MTIKDKEIKEILVILSISQERRQKLLLGAKLKYSIDIDFLPVVIPPTDEASGDEYCEYSTFSLVRKECIEVLEQLALRLWTYKNSETKEWSVYLKRC